ncbi:uncharacterized protein LOC120121077 isoform X2 [Hibiscus syriacus]|uniref:uncharacterized protein LOC120121077 isoform X2 n=1 Tax=Hibiscus syriacus TaxID=106335 RepID=UPI001922BB85|nr:uncharacterized protein LOC120121077 isoform X2 [Hibiscus syriacus]
MYYPINLLFVNIVLLCLDVLLAFIAFFQLCRIHLQNQRVGWTSQKVLHLMIGSSNCALPRILFLAAFLLLLSFWADLCHQTNDEEDGVEEHNSQQPLLESSKNKTGLSNIDMRRKCCSFQGIHVGSRQKFVIVVIMLNVFLMIAFAAIIRIGAGKNPSHSLVVVRVYVDFLTTSVLLMGGAFGCYGFLLFSKWRRVRSEKASSEMRKVVGLAVVSVLCFTSSSLIALLSDVLLFHHWNPKEIIGIEAPVLLILHHVLGTSVPFALDYGS